MLLKRKNNPDRVWNPNNNMPVMTAMFTNNELLAERFNNIIIFGI